MGAISSISINQSSIIRNSDLMWWYDASKRKGTTSNSLVDLTGRGQNLSWIVGTPPISNGIIDNRLGYIARNFNMIDRDIADMTISVWFKVSYLDQPSANFVHQPVIILMDELPLSYNLYLSFNDFYPVFNYFNSTGGTAFQLGTGGNTDSLNPFLNNTWYHYTVVRRGTLTPKWYHYVNGVLSGLTSNEIGSTNSTILPSSQSGTVRLSFGNSMRGYLGPIYAYKRALTDTQILWNYNADKNRFI